MLLLLLVVLMIGGDDQRWGDLSPTTWPEAPSWGVGQHLEKGEEEKGEGKKKKKGE